MNVKATAMTSTAHDRPMDLRIDALFHDPFAPRAASSAHARLPSVALDALLASVVGDGLDRLGLSRAATALEIAELPLPEPISAPGDQSLLRALGPLYLASELEAAGLLPAVEELTALWASGGLPADVRGATEQLAAFWRGRDERFSPSERKALFARVFGAESGPVLAGSAPANREFLLRLLDLADTLTRAGDAAAYGPDARLDAELRLRARLLAENLAHHGDGFVLYAAGDILSAVQSGIAILQALAAAHLWGSRDLWTLLARLHQRRRRAAPDVLAHARRGQAGMALLGWLANVLPSLGGSQPLLPVPSEIIGAAAAWIQNSLAIESEDRRSLERAA